jgi:hypothetical protein
MYKQTAAMLFLLIVQKKAIFSKTHTMYLINILFCLTYELVVNSVIVIHCKCNHCSHECVVLCMYWVSSSTLNNISVVLYP